MSDSPNTFFSPYPGTLSQQGTNDDSYRATLTAHSASSIERNQDSQFSAVRSQFVHKDVLDNRFHAERSAREADRVRDAQYADLKSELASMRTESLTREIAALRDGRQTDLITQVLQLVKK